MKTQQIGVLEMLNSKLAFSLSVSPFAALGLSFPCRRRKASLRVRTRGAALLSEPGPGVVVGCDRRWGKATQVLGVFWWERSWGGGAAGGKQFIGPIFQVRE